MICFLQDAEEDSFDPVAELNDPGVMASFHTALTRTREHLLCALREAQPGGKQLCYQFQVGAALLMALLDGIAVYVEKKVAAPPSQGRVYWAGGGITFLDPRFESRCVRRGERRGKCTRRSRTHCVG
jgi:hypothetical protein